MNYSVRNIVIAVVLAICAIGAVLVYTSSVQQSAKQGQTYVKVLVATRDIPAGTSAQDIDKQGLLQLKDVVRTDQVPGALVSTAGISGQVADQPIYAGQQAVAANFSLPKTVAAPIALKGNERAVSLSLPATDALAGVIRDGDHVDVSAAYTVSVTQGGNQADVKLAAPLMRDIYVIKAAPAPSGGLGGTDKVTVLLKTTDTQATQLIYAQQFANTVKLIARPVSGAKDSAATVATAADVVTAQLNGAQKAKIIKATKISSN
jgi:pilus assembly protein CpaB